ncbi:hypothetical protein FQR65_LT10752 [Abscondita terminalis]|nr:hypothetical protein FQR65_LT10752 [Abscondita terminalis]
MDRRNAEVRAQLKKLQDECGSTVDLLNVLLQMCAAEVNRFVNINPSDFRLHSKYFLAITQFQCEMYQKILEININLEDHIETKQLPKLEQPYVENQTHGVLEGKLKPDVLKLDFAVLEEEPNQAINAQNPKLVSDVVDSVEEFPKDQKLEQCVKEELHQVESDLVQLDSHVVVTEPTECLYVDVDKQIENEIDFVTSFETDTILGTSANLNIKDKLIELAESSRKKDVTVEVVPGVGLQPSQKKMSTIVKEKLVKFDTTPGLFDEDATSSEEDFLQQEFLLDIKERCEPKVNDLCMIGHIESPSSFYIQVADENSAVLDLLSAQLESLSSRNCENLTKSEAKKTLGNFCCIEIDNIWYRCEILDWMLNSTGLRLEQVLLQLIDYGNTMFINYKNLCPMLRELFDIPKMAQLCHLDGLYPPGSNLKNILKKWPSESKDGFLNICGDLSLNLFQITHVAKDLQKNSFGIDFIHTEESRSEHTVGQIFYDAKLAVDIYDETLFGDNSMMKQVLASHGMKHIQPNMSRDDILDLYFAENNEPEARTINEAVMSYDPKDEARTCRNLRKDGTCYKGNKCRFRHVPLKDGYTRDKHPTYNKAFVDTPMPSAGDEVLMTISHVCDVRRFYAQIRDSEKGKWDQPTINGLITAMNKPETVKRYKTLRYPPGLSQLVIVKHWNGYWYRGQVKYVSIPENCEDVMVEVYVVDFGDTLNVSMSNIRSIFTEFLSMPFQAIECRLNNVKHKTGADENEEKKYLESRCLGQTFKAKIIAAPGYLEVLLYTKDNEDLGEKIIAAGYGETNTEHVFPKDNEIYLID